MHLKDIAEISTGLIISRKQDSKSNHEYKFINLKSTNNSGEINFDQVDSFNTSADVSRYVVEEEDVILKLTPPFRATYIPKLDQQYVLSHHFCKLRIKSNKISPKYLAWYINSSHSNRFFSIIKHGTTIRRLPISKLKTMDVKVIPKEEQEKIVQMNIFVKEEKALYKKLLTKRKEQLRGYSNQIISNFKEDQ